MAASEEEVENAILGKISELVEGSFGETTARMILGLAEAYAWVRYPNQSHGGGTKAKTG